MSRAFLSSKLALKGHDILVYASDLFDAVGWPGPGLFIGKNCFREYAPHDLRYYHEMKASGIEIWYNDEEGGLLPGAGPEEWRRNLFSRTDPGVFSAEEKILAWGNFQRDCYTDFGVKAHVEVVGSVNFELYKPEYSPAFREYDYMQTGGLSDYVLVNTRTPAATSGVLGNTHVINGPPYTFSLSDRERYDLLSHEGVVLYEVLGLVAELALQHPNQQIVIRPHPAENPSFYKSILGDLPNVRVTGDGDAGAWIRRARCLIQNGCTTAIQANIAGKRVITFVPPGTEAAAFVSPFPDEVGWRTGNREEACAAVFAQDVPQARGKWDLIISSLDTINHICTMVDARQGDGSINEGRLKSLLRKRDWNLSARRLAYHCVPGKVSQHRLRETVFGRALFDSFGVLVRIASSHWGAHVSAERLSLDCWRVKCR